MKTTLEQSRLANQESIRLASMRLIESSMRLAELSRSLGHQADADRSLAIAGRAWTSYYNANR